MQGDIQYNLLIIFILLVALSSLVFIIWIMSIYMRNYYNNTTTSFHEVEIIRRHLPCIINVLTQSNKIMEYNEKMILPKASVSIVYGFRKLNEIEKLSIYAIALMEERYELLSELNKVVDDDFRAKIPVMVDIINSLSKTETEQTINL